MTLQLQENLFWVGSSTNLDKKIAQFEHVLDGDGEFILCSKIYDQNCDGHFF